MNIILNGSLNIYKNNLLKIQVNLKDFIKLIEFMKLKNQDKKKFN